VRHTYTPGWHLPGGGVEKGETTLEALAKELEEEAGARLTGPPRLIAIYSNFQTFPGDHVLLYEAPHWAPTPPTATGEIAERAFFPLAAPPQGTTPGTLRRLRELAGDAEISAVW
jgi:8-oxo-dGTP pyrophosphatase MutT (NUDIX family)